jgi:hypothetical protein
MERVNLVTGYWPIRKDRKESTYLNNFKNVLKLSHNMTVFVPEKYKSFVEEHRSNILEKTNIIITELDDIRELYFVNYWDKLQKIRTNPTWYNSTDWLPHNPQCFSEWYNPVVMSKVFFLYNSYKIDVFGSDVFIWIDAGITQHISTDVVCDKSITNMSKYVQSVLFSSINYVGKEVHGFDYAGYKKYTTIIPTWLCRATIFGCHKNYIEKFNADYSYYLKDTLDEGYLGTEESIFSLLSCVSPEIYNRYHMNGTSMPDLLLQRMKYE